MILKRYINREIIQTTGAILIVLILIFISTRFVKYIQLAVDGSISSGAVFSLLGLQIPAVAGFLLPLSMFIAVLLTLGRLYADNEMAVIHSVGISELKLAKSILPIMTIMAMIAGSLSFWVTPWSGYQTKTMMAREKAESELGAFAPGKFQETSSRSAVVFVESKQPDGDIKGVFAVSGINKATGQLEIQVARSGKFSRIENKVAQQNRINDAEPDEQNFLVLENGQTYVFNRQTKRWQITQYDAYFMLVDEPEVEKIGQQHKAMPSQQLLQDGSAAAWAEIHWRLSAPLSIPILCFLAIPLARTQPRKGKFSRLFPAIMVYLVYGLMMLNTRRLIENEKLPEELGFWWIHLLAIMLCIWLYRPRSIRRKLIRRSAHV